VYNGNKTRTRVLGYRSSKVVIQVYMCSAVVLGKYSGTGYYSGTGKLE